MINTLIVVAPGTTANSNTQVIDYDYNQVFSIKNMLENVFTNNNPNDTSFMLVTCENFLAQSGQNGKINFLNERKLRQAHQELRQCAIEYPQALFLAHGVVETEHEEFSAKFYDDLAQWRRLSSGSLYPYMYSPTNQKIDSLKSNKIRNTAANSRDFLDNSLVYSLSLGYAYNTKQARFKTMNLGNYSSIYPDYLNLNLQDPNYYNNVSIEQLPPYYANGYPNLLFNFDPINIFLLIGQDAYSVWNVEELMQYEKTSFINNPLIIQCDSTSTSPTLSQYYPALNADSFFTQLFHGNVISSSDSELYPQIFTVNMANLDNCQQKIVNFLSRLPYILFADTQGYIPPSGTTNQTTGAIYQGELKGTQYIFTRQDSAISKQGTFSFGGSTPAVYTQYNVSI